MSDRRNHNRMIMKGKGWLVAGGILLALMAVLWVWLGPLISTALRAGFLDKPEERTLEAGQTQENLKTMHQAILMYSESEGALPEASGWMDAAYTRLKTADLKEEEAKKQMKALDGMGPDEYGYAMNQALSGKDPFDERLKGQILLFESKNLDWNAKGDPKKDGAVGRQTHGITLGGNLKPLKTP